MINPKTLKDVSPECHKGLLLVRKTLAEKGVVRPSLKGYTLVESMERKKKIPLNTIVYSREMTCSKQKITKHVRFDMFRSSLEKVMSRILKDDNYLYYKYDLFIGMEDKKLRDHYPCHTDMITYSFSAHKHSIPHFLKKLKKQLICEHWGLYKYLTHEMCKRGDDRMDSFAMESDDKEENKEMTDDDDFTDMTPEYMFQKFKLVLFLLAEMTAYHIIPCLN